MCLSQIEQMVSIVRDVATVLAIAAGGAWSYKLFRQKRQKYPRATIEHKITHRRVCYDRVLLHVEVVVSNVGDVLIELVESATIVSQILPLPADLKDRIAAGQDPVEEPKTDVDWPALGSRENRWQKQDCEIEPGEVQGIQRDFVLDDDVRSVHVYSYVINEEKRSEELSWDVTTLYDIADSPRSWAAAAGEQDA